MQEGDKKQALLLLKDSIASVWKKYIIFFVVVLLTSIIALLPPQIYQHFFAAMHQQEGTPIKALLVFGLCVAMGLLLSTAIFVYAREWLRCEIECYLRNVSLRALFETDLQQLESMHRGEWLTSISQDLIAAEDFLTLSLPSQIKNTLMFIGASGLFIYHGGIFGLLPIGIALFLVVLNLTIQKRLSPALTEIRNLHGDVYQQLIENFEGLRTIRSFGGESRVHDNFTGMIANINHKSLTIMRSFALLMGATEFFILLGITSILSLALYGLTLDKLTFADAMVYPFYMGIFFMTVSSFYQSNYDWNLYFTKGSRLAHLIYGMKHKTIASNTVHHDMSFNDIELRYPNQPLLVPHFDLTIKKNQVLGIVGPSGSGKSTLLEFLAGLRPLACGAREIECAPHLTAYVEQKPYIFGGTIADNLSFGCNAKVSQSAMWNALDKTGLRNLIDSRRGLSFMVRDRGQNLSEGEKYRLGIARAILTEKPYLLLDEPFAALDLHSINIIVKLIDEERTKRGIVIVTHYVPGSLVFDDVLDFAKLKETANKALYSKTSLSMNAITREIHEPA